MLEAWRLYSLYISNILFERLTCCEIYVLWCYFPLELFEIQILAFALINQYIWCPGIWEYVRAVSLIMGQIKDIDIGKKLKLFSFKINRFHKKSSSIFSFTSCCDSLLKQTDQVELAAGSFRLTPDLGLQFLLQVSLGRQTVHI